ncbi:MAG: TIGR02300 family protein [Aestuariivita sp.]|nr:TIGR02300 family protein [Aestuariivita sp.]MCY4204087.1 TIGR02300 family protein [Aestuariivita sp.]MCY4287613.1 TIGR02300 family protein [Aestuariivita sp.]MCY4346103.1 TIGR02300 family protein [Aestuariivita sp.]
MPKKEWGVKRECPETEKRFYDLNRDPIVSPYTGEVVELDAGKSQMTTARTVTEKPKSKQENIADDAVIADDDGVNVAIDDDLLDEDEEDSVSLDDIADLPSEDED